MQQFGIQSANKQEFDMPTYALEHKPIPVGKEQHWLDQHEGKVTHYAILDDGSDMLEHQKERFVQTENAVGLLDHHVDKLKQLLETK